MVVKMNSNFTGSIDTKRKLDNLSKYLQSYSVALKNQGFARIYIDAFAGTGSRTETQPALPLFGEIEPQEIDTPGSASIALSTTPSFDTLAFFEKDSRRFKQLEKLKEKYPAQKIVLRQGDANEYVKRICERVKWHQYQDGLKGFRGVIFLDPYGMEVEWKTVEAIANTEALDCWYFFPLSGLYRNAPHNPAKLDSAKEDALDRVLGTKDWREKWYKQNIDRQSLFESDEEATARADVDAIEAYVAERLRSIFKGVVMPPVRLRHNGGAPMASLFFAVSNPNPKAVALAKRISSHILESGKPSQIRSR